MIRMFFASSRIRDGEHAAHRIHAERDESLLIRIGFVIRDRDATGVVKKKSLRPSDTELAVVDSARVHPTEVHSSSSVRTRWAYVDSDATGTCGTFIGEFRQQLRYDLSNIPVSFKVVSIAANRVRVSR